ncbi:MAG: isoprenylcysteine carboxylmethyltransferase family protein [Gemmatimonadota bacterium]|nr:isoprenylcysteine carboxylmethyltransferase family protein [Gemmatimonadota bacterium]
MRPPPFIWPYALLFWTVYAWGLIPELRIIRRAREESKRAGSKDAGSVRVMMGVMSAVMVLAFPLAFVERWAFPESLQRVLFAAGILLMVLGSLLRRYCWTTLGDYFTGDVQVRAGQPVIRTGPYRLVRHPSYTGGTLMQAGVGLALCNWASLVLLTVTAIVTYVYRVRIEEAAMLGTLGEPYRDYMRESKRFIPYVV